MFSRTVFRVATVCLIASSPVMARSRGFHDSRGTAMERLQERRKVLAQMEADGFVPIPKIVGGNDADEGEYPWMAALVDAAEADNFQAHFCGATLIHPYWVLTAAHCVSGTRAEDLEVLLGATDLSDSGGTQRIEVAEIIVAPKYHDVAIDSDFALLRLKQAADPSLPVITVADDASLVAPNVVSTVVGWGDMSNGEGDFPTQLQEVQLPTVDLELANNSEAYGETLTANMLAAGFGDGGKDSCSGDSGGPLLVPSPVAPGWVQGGIVSFGIGCADPGIYGIYTRISNFRDFITGHILPNYAVWEKENGRRGEGRDPDGNGFSNFEDFALPDHVLDQTTVSGMRRFSYVRPVEAGEVDYVLENAPTISGPWAWVQPAFVSSQPLGDGLCRWTVELPAAGVSGVYRIRAGVARTVESNRRPLEFGSGARGVLDETDELEGVSRTRLYHLEDLPTDRPVTLTLRSTDFNAELELLNADTGAVLQASSNDSAEGLGGHDEAIQFTAQPGVSYLAKVIGSAGGFELSVWAPASVNGVPDFVIQPASGKKAKPVLVKGALAETDEIEPLFLPGHPFYKDDFRVLSPPGSLVEFKMASKGKPVTGIDDYLSLIDAESGRVLLANDNFTGKSDDAGLRFVPVPGKTYLLRTSSYGPRDSGSYTLSGSLPVLTTKTPLATLGLGKSVAGKLSAAGELDERYFTAKRDYLLDPVSSQQEVVVTLRSPKLDPYLMVIDASDLRVLTEKGGPRGNGEGATLRFVAKPEHRYIIRATAYEVRKAGSYTLSTAIDP